MKDYRQDPRNFYQILGMDRQRHYSDDEVRSLYRAKAREFHPDINKSPDASDEMKLVNLANEALRTEAGRRSYLEALTARETLEEQTRQEARRTTSGPRQESGTPTGGLHVRASDFADEHGRLRYESVDYWMRIVEGKGFPLNAFWRQIAEGTARFHRDFAAFTSGQTGLERILGDTSRQTSTQTPLGATIPGQINAGSLDWFATQPPVIQQLEIGRNNAALLLAMLRLGQSNENQRINIPQQESGTGFGPNFTNRYREARVAWQAERVGKEIRVSVNPLQLLTIINRPSQLPKQVDWRSIYQISEIPSAGDLKSRDVQGYIAAIQSLCSRLAWYDRQADVSKEIHAIRSWDRTSGVRDTVTVSIPKMREDLLRIQGEGGIRIESVTRPGTERKV